MRRYTVLLLSTQALHSCSTPDDLTDAEAGPREAAGLASTNMPAGRLLAQITKDRRQFEAHASGHLRALIPGVMEADLGASGLRSLAGDDEVFLRTTAVGEQPLEEATPALGGCAPTSEWIGARCAAAAEVEHRWLTEWFTSGPAGVRQGWTVHEAPSAADELVISVALDVGQILDIDTDGHGATLAGSTGGLWRYEGLLAWDATGRPLSAHLEEITPGLAIVVDVVGATWPVTVDPILGPANPIEHEAQASDGSTSDQLGLWVTAAGDVDGDGYDDLLVGAPGDDDDGTDSGSAYVYYGSATGISSSDETKLTASDAAAGDAFGTVVAGVGDLDDDGYDDVLVGAPQADSATGSAYVYFGSASGIDASSEHELTASDAATGDGFGGAVAAAGDLDDDGHDDLLVGAPDDDDSGTDGGSAYVYYGSATGVDTSREDKLTASDGAAGDAFGTALAFAGDLDGDGYADILVGSPADDDEGTDSGSLYVYYGTSSGIDSTSEAKHTASDGAAGDAFGSAVSSAGDLDADGYDDAIIGASGVDSDAGAVYLFYGKSTGLYGASEAQLTASDAATSDAFGWSVGGGQDLNDDGYDDLVVGAPGSDTTDTDAGAVYVYYGGVSGVSAGTEDIFLASSGAASDQFGIAVALSGDVDGDDTPDVLVGADGTDSETGSVYVVGHTARLTTTDADDEDYFGYAVARAGDIDADGYDDVAIGAHGAGPSSVTNGSIYVYFGSASGLDLDSEQELDGDWSEQLGLDLAGAGDVNGDGYDDLVSGALSAESPVSTQDPGVAYVYYGSATGVSESNSTTLYNPSPSGTGYLGFGMDVDGAGDVNGDGYDDIIVGDVSYNPGTYSGRVYVFYGSSTGPSVNDYDRFGSSDGTNQDYFGDELAGAGDLDGDGYDDIIVGAYGDDDNGSESGSVYVYYGSSGGIDTSSEEKLTAGTTNDRYGRYLAGVGDVDGDGLDDIVVTAVGADNKGTNAGYAWIYFGNASGMTSTTAQSIYASDAMTNHHFGRAVAGAGDIDGDGYADLIVGAPVDSDNGSYSGAAYVYYGQSGSLHLESEVKLTAPDGGASDYFGNGLAGVGDIDGDGFDDLVVGAYLWDGDSSNQGAAYLFGGGCRDLDEDGYCSDVDCHDGNAGINPGATETVGDGIDSDCDDTEICYADADDDGYVDGSTTVTSSDTDCDDAGEGTSSDSTGECDDSDDSIHPGATETVGDEIDQDCDGQEECTSCSTRSRSRSGGRSSRTCAAVPPRTSRPWRPWPSRRRASVGSRTRSRRTSWSSTRPRVSRSSSPKRSRATTASP